jgi:hypothetical protein
VFTALQQLFSCHCEPKVKGGEDCCLCFCDVLATLLQYKPRWHGSTCTSCQCMCTAGDHQSMCTAATVEYDRTPMQLQFMIEIGSGRGRHSGRARTDDSVVLPVLRSVSLVSERHRSRLLLYSSHRTGIL